MLAVGLLLYNKEKCYLNKYWCRCWL